MRASTIFLISLVVLLTGTIVYQFRRIEDLKARLFDARTRSVHPPPVTAQPQEQATLVSKLDAALQDNMKLRRTAESLHARQAGGVIERVDTLKETFARLPDQRIPELAYATESDWFTAVEGELETTDDFRIAMARIRESAAMRFGKILQRALQGYLTANGGTYPQETTQLVPFLSEGVDPVLLQRYKMVRADARLGEEWGITQVSLVDSKHDKTIVVATKRVGLFPGPKQ